MWRKSCGLRRLSPAFSQILVKALRRFEASSRVPSSLEKQGVGPRQAVFEERRAALSAAQAQDPAEVAATSRRCGADGSSVSRSGRACSSG